MAVTGGEMQRGVIATVHDVNAGAAHDEHVHDAAPALPARPVEGAESMVVTETTLNIKKRRICRVSVAAADEEPPLTPPPRLCQHNSFMQCFQ